MDAELTPCGCIPPPVRDALGAGQGYLAQIRGSTFQSEYGFGFACRLHASMPLNVVGGYGNDGGNQHTAYVGLGDDF
jgi:hypothetical protein